MSLTVNNERPKGHNSQSSALKVWWESKGWCDLRNGSKSNGLYWENGHGKDIWNCILFAMSFTVMSLFIATAIIKNFNFVTEKEILDFVIDKKLWVWSTCIR